MKNKSVYKVLLCFGLCLTLFFSSYGNLYSIQASAADTNQLSQLQQKNQEIENKQTDLDKKLEEARKNVEDQQKLKEALQEKINALEQQIDALNQTVEAYNKQISDMQAQIQRKESEISKDYDTLRQRIKMIYMAGEVSTIDLILGAKDFNDFIDKVNLVKCLSESDEKLIRTLQDAISDINADKEKAETARQEVNKDKEKLLQSREKLTDLQKECDVLIEKLQGDQKDLEEKNEAYEAEKKKLESEITDWFKSYFAENGAEILPSDTAAGMYAWPAPSCPIVTTEFDPQTHRGLDLACNGNAYGLPIVAAQDGEVIRVNRTDEWGSGWGYYLMIDHGGSFATLYAHCSVIVADAGDTVKKGQVIGYIGNTGRSYGAHLHFECWYNGSRYNPRYALGVV